MQSVRPHTLRKAKSISELPQEILEVLEGTSRRVAPCADLRRVARRRVRVRCTFRYLAGNGVTPLEAAGLLRDVSTCGAGFLAYRSLGAGTELALLARLPDGQGIMVTGMTVYSRSVHWNWYLIGMRFGPVNDLLPFPGYPVGRFFGCVSTG